MCFDFYWFCFLTIFVRRSVLPDDGLLSSTLMSARASPYTRTRSLSPDDALEKRNKLKIRAVDLDLELSGEPAYVEEAYDALRPILMERFRASVQKRAARQKTPVEPDAEEPLQPGFARPASSEHVNVVLTNEVYNKLYLVELDELSDAPITRAIDLRGVGRIYINRSQKENFGHFFKVGRVLWRELTAAGKAAVKGSS